MLTPVLIGVAILLIVFLVLVALRPADFRVARHTTIDAPPAAAFGLVNDFHHWDRWSPWAKLDPAMKHEISGAPAGAGAIYWWQGNRQVGEGRMTILESQPPERIRIKLEFLQPFAVTNTAEFTFQPAGQQTTVNWAMTGKQNFMFKAVGMFMSMDRMIGPDFEKGLARLKAEAERKG